MPIELVEKFLPYVDNVFTKESKKQIITNTDFDFYGAKTVKVYKITTASMKDYDRTGDSSQGSRYGAPDTLSAITEIFTLKKDRSFSYVIDKLDTDETGAALSAADALARQQREIIIPEIDGYIYQTMCENAGTKPNAITLTKTNIYDEIIKANTVLDNSEVPDTERFIIVSPEIYLLMKQCKDITLDTNVGQDIKLNGVISNLDGLNIIKVAKKRLPENFGFLIGHKVATVAPTKLEDYRIHKDPPGINGTLVEGRICYDAFVLDNKKMALYYQAVTA